MTQTRSLFPDVEPAHAPPMLPHNRTATSKLAARSMRSHAAAQQQRVLECLRQAGDAGLTDEEIQTALDLRGDSERPRRAKLVELGLVENAGVMRLTKSSHPAAVWRAVEQSKQPTDLSATPNKVAAEPIPDFAI